MPDHTTPPVPDEAAPGEAQLDLARARLTIDDGLLMVLGPEGDPVPPATVCALAADRPEASLAFDDGRKAPAGRVAAVLEAQAHGRLAPGSDQADGWLGVMLGLGPAPAVASDDELEAERDDLELTLFGNELVVGTATGGSFVIAVAGPGGSEPAAARLALGDGTAVGLEDLLGRLRRAAGLDPVEPAAAEQALPGCSFARDGDTLVLTTAQGETFVFTEADGNAPEGVALYTPDGELATFAGLAEVLGPGDASPEPMPASVDVEADAEPATGAQEVVQTAAVADDGAADPEPPERLEDDREVNAAQTEEEDSRIDVMSEASTPVGDEETDWPKDEAGEADDDEPVIGEDAPACPDAGAVAGSDAAMEAEQDDAGGASANGPQRTTIPCQVRIDDPSSLAIVLISRVPAGAVLSAGSDIGDGSWALSPDQLDALTITLPGDAPEPLALEARLITIDDRDGAMSSAARQVVLAPKAGEGAAQPAGRGGGTRLGLDGVVQEAAADRPVSAIVLGGLPADARLSAGLFDEDIRSWVIKPGELEDLQLSFGASTNGPFELRVTVVTMDQITGKPSARTRTIEVEPSPPTDRPADRGAERVGGVGFFRPLYDRRR